MIFERLGARGSETSTVHFPLVAQNQESIFAGDILNIFGPTFSERLSSLTGESFNGTLRRTAQTLTDRLWSRHVCLLFFSCCAAPVVDRLQPTASIYCAVRVGCGRKRPGDECQTCFCLSFAVSGRPLSCPSRQPTVQIVCGFPGALPFSGFVFVYCTFEVRGGPLTCKLPPPLVLYLLFRVRGSLK